MKFLLIACILATFSVAISLEPEQDQYFHLAVERPDDLTSDCSNLIFEMADCIGFMSNQETPKPSPECCKGLKTVLDTNEKCVCYALEAAPSMGISINISRAEKMPSLCQITNAPPISKCNISGSPGPSPATPAPAPAPAPVTPNPPRSPALPPPSPAPVSPNPPPSAPPTPATPPSSPVKPPTSPVSPTPPIPPSSPVKPPTSPVSPTPPPSSPPTSAAPSIAPTVSIVPPSREAPASSHKSASVAMHIQMPFLVSFSVVVASLFLF